MSSIQGVVHFSNALEQEAIRVAQSEQLDFKNRAFCYLIEFLRQIEANKYRSKVEIG